MCLLMIFSSQFLHCGKLKSVYEPPSYFCSFEQHRLSLIQGLYSPYTGWVTGRPVATSCYFCVNKKLYVVLHDTRLLKIF